ncbi:MAG TPA: hypothetical protein EYP67_03185 [Methanosarcinales archaeon]|nr:hypothetical protein [Methanosarcinales archaeon]
MFLNVSEYGGGDVIVEKLLRKAYIAVTPGSAFGPMGADFIRISYAASSKRIHDALERIGDTIV